MFEERKAVEIANDSTSTVLDASQIESTKAKENVIVKPNTGIKEKSTDTKQYSVKSLQNILTEKLRTKEWHPRLNPEINNDGLVANIKLNGILEAPVVQESNDGSGMFDILSGSRRVAAAKNAGFKQIDCLVQPASTDADAAHQSFMSNKERESLNSIEEAKHLERMHSEFGFTDEELEIKGYGTGPSIAQKRILLRLSEHCQFLVATEKISPAHGREILRLHTHGEQDRLGKIAIKKGYTVKRLRTRITQYLNKGKVVTITDNSQSNNTDIVIPGVYFKSSANMSELEDNSVHLVMTSPPYGLGKEFEKGQTPKTAFEGNKPVLDELGRVVVPGGIMCINVADINYATGEKGKHKHTELHFIGVKYQDYLRPLGFHLRDVIVWWKYNLNWTNCAHMFPVSNTPHTDYRFANQTEQVLIFKKDGERELPSQEIQTVSHLTDDEFKQWGKNIWQINQVPNDGHPCVYPEELCKRLISMFSYQHDTVLDPWLGSGTTVKSAFDLGRRGVGYEREVMYKNTIMKKLGLLPETIVEDKPVSMVEFSRKSQEEIEALYPDNPESETQLNDVHEVKEEPFTNMSEATRAQFLSSPEA